MLLLVIDPSYVMTTWEYTVTLSTAPGSNYYLQLSTTRCTVYETYCALDDDSEFTLDLIDLAESEEDTFTYTNTPYDIRDETILVKRYEDQGISAYYFNSNDINREPDSIQIVNDINVGSGELFTGCLTGCMAIYEFALMGPIAGQVTLIGETSGSFDLFMGNNKVMSSTGGEATYQRNMAVGSIHLVHIIFNKSSESSELTLYW